MKPRLIAWGGYDVTKARVRLMLDALRAREALAAEIRIPVWDGVRDKSVAGTRAWAKAVLRFLAGLPGAWWRLLQVPGRPHILLPFPGTPDIFMIAPLARLQRRKIVLDAFLPIHDTVVRDRQLLSEDSLVGRFVKTFEKFGLRIADVIVTDTEAHADFYASEFAIDRARFVTVGVGAEALFVQRNPSQSVEHILGAADTRPTVLFYGQLIPLHGLATILEAAALCREDNFRWIIVGEGQQQRLIEDFMTRDAAAMTTWLRWVDYEYLPALIARADICLGVFGPSNKAGRVVPNKVIQCLSMGNAVITRAGPGLDTLSAKYPDQVITVPPADASALAAAVRTFFQRPRARRSPPSEAVAAELGPGIGIENLLLRL